jgi:hypothetical protein
VYALRDTPRFNEFAVLLETSNQIWANKSSALVIQVLANYELYKGFKLPLPDRLFDAGSAYTLLALEAAGRGY